MPSRYNSKCYKVDEIDFSQNCLSTFVDNNGEDKSYVDYYKKHYGITIKDTKQPLLISRSKRKTVEEADVSKLIALVPELCNMTGLTEQMKADFRVMKDVAQFTRITPAQRQVAMQKFLDNVTNSAEASSHLDTFQPSSPVTRSSLTPSSRPSSRPSGSSTGSTTSGRRRFWCSGTAWATRSSSSWPCTRRSSSGTRSVTSRRTTSPALGSSWCRRGSRR